MTRTIAGLERLGLVERQPHPSDGRQVVVALTPAAQVVIDRDRQRRDAWLAQRLNDLSAEERDLLRRVAPILDRLVDA